MKKLTIVTPTYNRKHTLGKVYESLKRQTSFDFVWMIVDDGSTDGTEQFVQELQHRIDNSFDIKYLHKENGGKASALNLALEQISTDYFCCLDSDDTFAEKAVEQVLVLLKEEENNAECCGVLALRTTPSGTVMGGKRIDNLFQYASVADIYFGAEVLGTEFICFYKYDMVKNIRFHIFEGEKFVSPTWFQYKATENKKFRISGETYCYCEYMQDGLTVNKRKVIVQNPHGYTAVKLESFKKSRTIKQKLKNGIMYLCGCFLGKDSAWLVNAPYKCLTILCVPVALIVCQVRFGTQKKEYSRR